jgi:hypothetical protein
MSMLQHQLVEVIGAQLYEPCDDAPLQVEPKGRLKLRKLALHHRFNTFCTLLLPYYQQHPRGKLARVTGFKTLK